MAKWEDISDMLTPKGREELKVGFVLKFEDGTALKIRRRINGKVWAEHITLYTPEELESFRSAVQEA